MPPCVRGREPNTHERSALREHIRHLRYVLLAALAAAILFPTPAAGADGAVVATDKMQAAEARLLREMNEIRVRNGRKPLRLDKRTSHVARSRSLDMAAKRYFAHTEPDGDEAEDILERRDISAKEVTENIGHTVGLTLKAGSSRMADWWYDSPPHRVQMLARDVNYVGVGIARYGSRFTYTAIFTRSPDRTSPRVVIDAKSWHTSADGSEIMVDWHGVDPKLATGTAGIKRFEVQLITPLGDWARVETDPQESKVRLKMLGSGDQHVRIRAVDKVGNKGPWKYARIAIPDNLPSRVMTAPPLPGSTSATLA